MMKYVIVVAMITTRHHCHPMMVSAILLQSSSSSSSSHRHQHITRGKIWKSSDPYGAYCWPSELQLPQNRQPISRSSLSPSTTTRGLRRKKQTMLMFHPNDGIVSSSSSYSPSLSAIINARIQGATSLAAVSTSTSLLMDYTEPAIKYFQTLRIPAALIAGSSLSALFVQLQKKQLQVRRVQMELGDDQSEQDQQESNLYYAVRYMYHVAAGLGLLLSLNVIVIATAASNTLIIGEDYQTSLQKLLAGGGSRGGRRKVVLATCMLDFLRQHDILYEFIATRWSFYMSMFCLLVAVTSRILIQFNLLNSNVNNTTNNNTTKEAIFVVASSIAMMSHMIHLLNDRLYVYPNLFVMTIGLFKVRVT